MPYEIERKFLPASDAWRGLFRSRVHLTDGLIGATGDTRTRVRIAGEGATLTVKTKGNGLVRGEYEYSIPFGDAQEMLATCCGGDILTKWRHYIDHEGLTWEVDEYEGLLAGIVIVEVELERADQHVPMPDWVGAEVTGNPAYQKINMLRQRRADQSKSM